MDLSTIHNIRYYLNLTLESTYDGDRRKQAETLIKEDLALKKYKDPAIELIQQEYEVDVDTKRLPFITHLN